MCGSSVIRGTICCARINVFYSEPSDVFIAKCDVRLNLLAALSVCQHVQYIVVHWPTITSSAAYVVVVIVIAVVIVVVVILKIIVIVIVAILIIVLVVWW